MQRGGAGVVPWIGGLNDIQEHYDAFLFDLWGVVHNGHVAFPWAVRVLEELKTRGQPVAFLSNSSRRRDTNIAALTRLGVRRDLYVDLITSGDETWTALADPTAASPVVADLPKQVLDAGRVLTIGNGEDDAEYLASLAARCSPASAEEAELLLARGCSTLCADVGGPRKATWQQIEEALTVAAKRGVPMLVANPDSVRPDGADSPMPGRLARRYLELGGPAPHFIGKPYRAIFSTGLARLRAAASVPEGARICMVGDSVWHDVRGARTAGLDVVLLCSGVHSVALGIEQAPAPPRRPSDERLLGFLGALLPEEAPTYVTAALTWEAVAAGSPAAPAGAPAEPPTAVVCGLACVDLAQQLASYPDADAKVRAMTSKWLGGGNAANTACALARLGTPTALLTKIGDDALGDIILGGLRTDGVSTRFVSRTPNSPSAFTSVIAEQRGSTRTCIHTPMTEELSSAEVTQLLASSDASQVLLGPSTRVVHLDGRHPDGALALARAAADVPGLLVAIDVERPRLGLDELLPLCGAIFSNSTFPQAWTGLESFPGALAAILDRCPRANFVVATRGSRGSLLMARKTVEGRLGKGAAVTAQGPVSCCHGSFGPYHTIACDVWPLPQNAGVVDSTGAGDVFIAGFLHAWLAGEALSVALATGSYVATAKLQHLGARLGNELRAEEVPLAVVGRCWAAGDN